MSLDHNPKENLKEAEEIFTNFLKKNSLSITKTRLKILSVIYQIEGHFTIDELELKLGDTSGTQKASIYRTIKHLLEAGLIAKIQTSSHTKVAYEHTIGHHHHDHLVCDRCGDIIEFHSEEIESIQENVAKQFEFELLHHSMVLTGICKSCQKFKQKKSPSNVIHIV